MKALWLPDVLRAAGLKVKTIPGWEKRGRPGSFSPRGILWHHTATGRNWTDAKVNSLLTNGRPGLNGPLSQLGLARDGTYYVIAAGKANHAGRGGWGRMKGNTTALGIEAFNSGLGEPWPAEQYEAYVRGSAAILRHLGTDQKDMAGHKEFAVPRGRKPDPAGIDMEKARMDVRKVMAGGSLPAPTLKRGARGALVEKMQRIVGTTDDGAFGPGTEAAVAAWQRKNGLPITGVFAPSDWKFAESGDQAVTPPPARPTPAQAAEKIVRKDAEGEALDSEEIKFFKGFYAEAKRWDASPTSFFHLLRHWRWMRANEQGDYKSYLND